MRELHACDFCGEKSQLSVFSSLRGDEGGIPAPGGAALARDVLAFAGVWRGWGHAIAGVALGGAAWMVFLPLVSGFMLASSLVRLALAGTWALGHAEARRRPELLTVCLSTLVAAGLQFVLLRLVLHDIDGATTRLPYPTVFPSLVVPFTWIFLNNLAAHRSKRLEIPPLLDRLRVREVLEESFGGVFQRRQARDPHFLGDRGDTGPNLVLAFMFWVVMAASLAATGVSLLALPGHLLRAAWEAAEHGVAVPSPPVTPDLTPTATPAPTTSPASPTSGSATVDPSAKPPTETARERCHYYPEHVFAENPIVPESIVELLTTTYYEIGGGAREIGCPDRGVEAREDLYLSVLSRGQSDPSLLIVANGKGAVVYDHLFQYAWRLLRRDRLLSAEVKGSTGRGDYQIFHLDDGSCVLANRPVLVTEPFVVLPKIVTHVVIRLTNMEGVYPEIEELDPAPSIVGRGRFKVTWSSATGPQEKLIISRQNAEEVLGGVVQDVIDIHECPDVEVFDAVAALAERKFERELGID